MVSDGLLRRLMRVCQHIASCKSCAWVCACEEQGIEAGSTAGATKLYQIRRGAMQVNPVHSPGWPAPVASATVISHTRTRTHPLTCRKLQFRAHTASTSSVMRPVARDVSWNSETTETETTGGA